MEKHQDLQTKWEKFEEFNIKLSKYKQTQNDLTFTEIKNIQKELWLEFEESLDKLQKTAKYSRSSYSREFAAAQLEYFTRIRKLLFSLNNENEEEIHLLHAEFALDFVDYSLLYSMLSTLNAMDLTERKELNERN